MGRLVSGAGRAGAARLVDPLARGLLRLRVSPDAVTVIGTLGVVAGAVGFGARGQFLPAVLVVAAFAFTDMLDGAMARRRGTTRFGAVLDSTMDRVADGAILAAIGFWYASIGELPTLAAALLCLVTGQLVPYVQARALSLGVTGTVGVVERTERLLLIGVGTLATGLGLGWALPVALWLLAALSAVTVGQRLWHVRRAESR